jgi:hypothetical protein
VRDWQCILGVDADVDAVALKRAYARLLKSNRPDEDPEAFQRIQTAFETGLAHIQRRSVLIAIDEEEWEEAEADSAGETDAYERGREGAEEEDIALPWQSSRESDDDEDPAEGLESPEPVRDEVGELVEETIELALAGNVETLRQWLEAREELYSLDFKLAVSKRLLWRLPAFEDRIGWRMAEALFRFFEIDGVSDPRLAGNYGAYELWQRVRADERFEQAKQKMRSKHYSTWTERMVDRELFGAPGGGRRRQLMLWSPFAGKQLRERYEELRALDPVRVESAFAPGVLEYWLPITDPDRLPWRRVLPQSLLICAVTLLVSLLLTSAHFSVGHLLRVWAVLSGLALGGWWGYAVFIVSVRGYWRWRNDLYGGGAAPAGAPILADGYSAFWLVFDLLTLALAAAFELFAWPYGLLVFVIAFVYFAWLGRVQLGSHKRLEEVGFLVAGVALLLPVAGWMLGESVTQPVLLAASALASLGVIVFDQVHARVLKRSVVEVRDAVSWPMWVAAIAMGVAAWKIWS